MIIAIDGPSGTGKSTVAKAVAKRLGFTFFDTGAMYRSFAWLLDREKIDPADTAQIVSLLPLFSYEIRNFSNGEKRYFVGQFDVTDEIRTQAIAALASQIAMLAPVREKLMEIQRSFAEGTHAVFEGRDMGSVVFPDADLKIFLTAQSSVRAERRLGELLQKFPDLSIDYEQILQEIEMRDEMDTKRSISPLKQAPDAILIDTSFLSVEKIVEKIVRMAFKKLSFGKMHFFYRIIYRLCRLFFQICFRLRIYGVEHVCPGSAIIAANHASFYDPPVLSISCPEEVHFLAKGALFRLPILGFFIRHLNAHPIERGVSDAAVFRLIVKLLKEGKKVILFPEGKRAETDDLQPFEKGLGFLVQKAECRVIPAYISGSLDAWGPGKFPKFFGKMSVVFGSPIFFEKSQNKKEAQEEVTKKVEKAILALRQWLEEGAVGNPP